MSNGTDARIIIDRLLRDAEWDIEDKARSQPKRPPPMTAPITC
jgi:hypothetical protein